MAPYWDVTLRDSPCERATTAAMASSPTQRRRACWRHPDAIDARERADRGAIPSAVDAAHVLTYLVYSYAHRSLGAERLVVARRVRVALDGVVDVRREGRVLAEGARRRVQVARAHEVVGLS